jgi:macrolide phosphotransferase
VVTHSALQLAALATAAVPGLVPVTVDQPRADGMDYDVTVVTDDRQHRWVVRAPRRTAAAAGLDAERRLLPLLARRLPVPVPAPVGRESSRADDTCLVYPRLAGSPLDPARLTGGSALAFQVGRLLGALHEVDPRLLEDAGRPSYSAEEYRRRRLCDLDRAAGSGRVPAPLLDRWESELEDVTRWRFASTPVHGDLAGDHVLVDGGSISGLIDWGEACVADPADDLAWVALGAEPTGLDTVLEAYAMARSEAPDPHLLDRARLAGELALVRWLLGGLAVQDQEVIRRAAAALDDLAERVCPQTVSLTDGRVAAFPAGATAAAGG